MNLAHTASLVNYFNVLDNVVLETLNGNSAWALIKTEVFSRSRTYNFSDPDQVFPEIGFSLTLKRVSEYYVYNIIAPVLLLTLLSWLVFVIPVKAGEKMGLQITIMLSFSVMLLVMGDIAPRSGKTTPLIGMKMQCMCIKIVYLSQLDRSFFILWFAFLFAASFIINIMCLLSASLVISIWILNLYFHSDDKPVPKWIKWLVLEWLATTVCLKCRCPVSKVSAANSGSPETRIVMGSVASINVNEDFSSRKKTGKEIIQPGYVCAFIPRSVEKEEAAAISDQNKSDWQSLARVLDRFFLVISLVAIIIITVMTYTEYNSND